MAEKKTGVKIIAQNKKAYHDYFVEEKYEAGIALFGTEVKSIRAGAVPVHFSSLIPRVSMFTLANSTSSLP